MRSPLFILAIVALIGCDAPVVEWDAPATIAAAPGTRLVIDSAGSARFAPDSSFVPVISAAGVCPTSVRAAYGKSVVRAVWWSVRPDSSAGLYMAASSDSGRTWGG